MPDDIEKESHACTHKGRHSVPEIRPVSEGEIAGRIVVIHTWGARLRALVGAAAHLCAIGILVAMFLNIVISSTMGWAIFLVMVLYSITLLR